MTEKKKPVVVGIGEILWDMLPGGRRAGGAPINFVYHAAAMGAEGYAISAVGNDPDGDEILRELKRHCPPDRPGSPPDRKGFGRTQKRHPFLYHCRRRRLGLHSVRTPGFGNRAPRRRRLLRNARFKNPCQPPKRRPPA